MRIIRSLAVWAITLVLGIGFGCGGDNNNLAVVRQAVPEDVAGFWTWKIDDLPCQVPDGFLNGSDGDETFRVSQDGNDLSAEFVDSAGNRVIFSGTINGETISGTFTINPPHEVPEPDPDPEPAPQPTQVNGAEAPCLGKGYVAQTDDDTVAVFDLATNIELKTITVGDDPRGLDITPDGRFVFVANRFDNTVSVIRTSDDTVIKTITLTGTGEPYNVEVTPNGRFVYVVNKTAGADDAETSDVSVIKVDGLTEVDTISLTGTSPEGLVITPDGERVFVVNRKSDTVDVIDTASGTVMFPGLDAPSSPRDATVLPDGSKVYVVGEGGLGVLPGSGAFAGEIPLVEGVRGRDIVASPDGSRVFVAGGPFSSTVYVVDTATDTLEGTIDLSTGGAYGIDICSNGMYAFVSNDSDRMALVNLTEMREETAFVVNGNSPNKWVKLLEQQAVSLSFSGIVAFHPDDTGSMLDGDFQVEEDSLDGCVGAVLDFWIFIDTGVPEPASK